MKSDNRSLPYHRQSRCNGFHPIHSSDRVCRQHWFFFKNLQDRLAGGRLRKNFDPKEFHSSPLRVSVFSPSGRFASDVAKSHSDGKWLSSYTIRQPIGERSTQWYNSVPAGTIVSGKNRNGSASRRMPLAVSDHDHDLKVLPGLARQDVDLEC